MENKSGVHKVLLDKLDWGHKYNFELYAGNTHGLGEPDKRTLHEEIKRFVKFFAFISFISYFLLSAYQKSVWL